MNRTTRETKARKKERESREAIARLEATVIADGKNDERFGLVASAVLALSPEDAAAVRAQALAPVRKKPARVRKHGRDRQLGQVQKHKARRA